MLRKLDPARAVRIGLRQAKAEFDRGSAVFVDVRGREDFDLSHIPGAISIPSKVLLRRAGEIPQGLSIIFY